MFKEVLSKISEIILVTLFLVILSPIIIAVILSICVRSILEYIFKKIRRDPIVKLGQLVDLPAESQIPDAETFEKAKQYFDTLTHKIGTLSNATISELSVVNSEVVHDDENQIIISRQLDTQAALVSFEIVIDEYEIDNGENEYSAREDGDDFALIESIIARIEFNDRKTRSISLRIDSSHYAAHFCVAILNGRGRVNTKSGQIWAYLEDEKQWMVKLNRKRYGEFGFRSKYKQGKARQFWLDAQ